MANPYGPYSTSNMLGANFDEKYPPASDTSFPLVPQPPFALGQSAMGTDNSTWVFVVADVPVGANVTAATVNADSHITLATGGAYTTTTAFAVGEYGWVRKTTTPL
jgi:hypothetical protein